MKKDVKEVKKVTEETPIYVVAQHMDSEDEIDLVELFNVIWKRKIFLLIWTIVITGIAVGVVYNRPLKYKATATFYPPSQNDVKNINVKNDSENSHVFYGYLVSNNCVYQHYILNLQNQYLDKGKYNKFCGQCMQNNKETLSFEKFSMSLSVDMPKKRTPDLPVTITLSGADPELLPVVLNQRIDYAMYTTKQEILEKRMKYINFEIGKIQSEIDAVREIKKRTLGEFPNAEKKKIDIDQQNENRYSSNEFFAEQLDSLNIELLKLKKIKEMNVHFSVCSYLVRPRSATLIASKKNLKILVALFGALISGIALILFKDFFLNKIKE